MGEIVTKTKLENASVDCQTLEDCINGPADTKVLSRLGRYYWTLATIDSKVNSVVIQSNIAISQINSQKNNVDAQASSAITSINNSKNSAQGALNDAINDFNSQGDSALNDLQSAINTIVIDDGVPALVVSTSNGENQQQINDVVGADWYAKAGGYAFGDRVRLLTGEIVQSTVNVNTNNPNVDMTGWVKTSLITINSVSEFTKINPSLGLIVLLTKYDLTVTTGGGFFECKAGSATDDGGHIFASRESGFYFERLTNEVNIFDYGIKTQTIAECKSGSAVDYYAKLVAAISRSKEKKLPLVCDIPLFNDEYTAESSGIFIKTGIDIAGLKILSGNLVLFIDATAFTPVIDKGTGSSWVLLNKNARYDADGKQYYSSSQGRQTLGSISIVNVRDKSTAPTLNGQLHTTAHSNFTGTLSAYKLGRKGVWLASTYDSSFVDVKVNQCGSNGYFAYDSRGYEPFADAIDETNACTFSNLMVHDSTDSALRCVGAKNSYLRIHEEKTIVTTNNGGTPVYLSPYGYYNSYVNMAGGFLGQWQCDAKNVNGHIYPHVSVIVQDDTAIGSLFTHERLVIHTSNNPPNTHGGSIATANCNELYVYANAKASVGNCRVSAKTYTGKYTLPGTVTVLDTTSSFDILQCDDNATLSGGTYTKLTCKDLSATGCAITKANAIDATISGATSFVGTLGATNLTLNSGTVSNANLTANATVNNGTVNKLVCVDLSHSNGVITNAQCSGNITSSGGTIDSSGGGGNLTITGEGNYRKLIMTGSGTVNISDLPNVQNCNFPAVVNVNANSSGVPAKIVGGYIGGSLNINTGANIAIGGGAHINGQLNIKEANLKFSSSDAYYAKLSVFTEATGYWVFNNSRFGAVSSNFRFGDNTTATLGMLSQHPYNKTLNLCTASGWKAMTTAT